MNEQTRDRLNISLTEWPISFVVRSKAGVCGLSLAGIVGSNPTGGMSLCCECCVLSGGRLLSGRSLVQRSPIEFDVYLCVCH